MAKKPMTSTDPAYAMRRPGRPRKSEAVLAQPTAPNNQSENDSEGEETKKEGGSLRFEMRLPPGVVADLELMREQTGNTFAAYIRQAILRALKEDKKGWNGK